MLSLRLPRPTRPLDAPVTSRLEVCPPALLEPADTGFRAWLRRRAAALPAGVEASQRVVQVREEFACTLDGIDSQHAHYLQHRIRHLRSLRELWHLRAEMFVLIAQACCESEAERRLSGLNRHFPMRGGKPQDRWA